MKIGTRYSDQDMDRKGPMGKAERSGAASKSGTSGSPERSGGVRPLAALLPKIARTALGHRGFAENGIITDWPAIVGPTLAARSTPVKLTFPAGRRQEATLVVRVGGSLALELQHLEPLVVERLNSYFGYRAVARLKILQGPTPASPEAREDPPPLDPVEEAALAQDISGIADGRLREALNGLGRALRRDSKRSQRS